MRKALARFSLLVLAMVTVMAASCGREKAPAPAGRADTANADIVLKLEPDPPIALKDTVFTAEVMDKTGAPLTGASVVFDLSMPGMYHGENRPAATEAGPGVYKGKGVLTMGGKWLIKVEVKADGVDVVREFYTVAEGG